MAKRTPFHLLPRAQQAGILCGTETFQQWLGETLISKGTILGAPECADQIRVICKVESRAHLDEDEDAAARFDAMRTDYDAWRGKIPSP